MSEAFVGTHLCTWPGKRDGVWRLRVEWEPDFGLAIIAEDHMAGAESARVVESTTITLTLDDATALHRMLGEYIRHRETNDPEGERGEERR